jgi:hypothetical protein
VATTADFLSEGAKSYIDALAAIEAFEKMACSKCRGVYEKYKPQLVGRMGIKDASCEDHDDNKDPANGFAELGVRQATKSGREDLFVYLQWEVAEDGAPEISACVMLEFSTRDDRNKWAKLLRKSLSIRPGDEDGHYLWSQKHLRDLSSCAEAFHELLDEWLASWPAGRRLK